MNFYQIVTPLITVGYLIIVFVLRSIIVWRQSGVNPFVFSSTEKAHDYLGFIYKLTVVVMALAIGAFSFFSPIYSFLNPISYLELENVKITGVTLLILAFIWTLIAQIQMSNSWRIGIDYDEKTELVNKGLFSISRNPVFLGVVVFYIGIFFIIPNSLTFTLVWVMLVTVQVQVRLEEEYLMDSHGADYQEYLKSVRRWL